MILMLNHAIGGALTIGDFAAFSSGILLVQTHCSTLLLALSSLREHLLYARDVFAVLESDVVPPSGQRSLQDPITTVEFDNVSFRYPNAERDALSNISFKVRLGDIVGIAGDNGAGKSTLIKLLLRLYEPSAGRIMINGTDASAYSATTVRSQMTALFQDFGQYYLSARENVGLGRIGAINDISEIERASLISGAKLPRLPRGWETRLGTGFVNAHQPSGGEWQRMALARCYLRDACVRVFDEPSSALDPAAEEDVVRQITSTSQSSLTFVVSHRLVAIRNATQILVLRLGTIVEKGTHDELVTSNSHYAKLFRLQSTAVSRAQTQCSLGQPSTH